MSKSIYKYPIEQGYNSSFKCSICLPEGANIIDINFQGKDIFVWALINKSKKENCVLPIYVVPTGAELAEHFLNLKTFIKTIHSEKNGLVFHLFVNDDSFKSDLFMLYSGTQ